MREGGPLLLCKECLFYALNVCVDNFGNKEAEIKDIISFSRLQTLWMTDNSRHISIQSRRKLATYTRMTYRTLVINTTTVQVLQTVINQTLIIIYYPQVTVECHVRHIGSATEIATVAHSWF